MSVPVGRPARRAVAFVGVVAGLAIALRLSAVGDLSSPPISSIDGLAAWVDARSSVAAAIALGRLGAELFAWYVLALSALHGLAAMPGLRASRRLAEALSTPGIARIVHTGLGAGLVVSSALASLNAAGSTATATMRPLVESTPGGANVTPTITTSPADGGTATMRPVLPAPDAPTRPSPTPQPPARPTTWTVTDGESFWSIATDIAEIDRGRAPTDAEVDPVWRALVAANQHRLVDLDDPDLIIPGQVFEVPGR